MNIYNKIKIGDIVRFCNDEDLRNNINRVDYYGIVVGSRTEQKQKHYMIRWLNHQYYSFDIAGSYSISGKFWSIIDTTNDIG